VNAVRFPLLAACAVLAAVLGAGAVRVPVTQPIASEPREPLPEITAAHTLVQSFTARSDGLSGLDVVVGTYARANTAHLYLSLATVAEPLNLITRTRIDTQTLADNQAYHLAFPPIDDSRGRRFILTLGSPDGAPGNAVTLWSSTADLYAEGALIIDGALQDRDLTLSLYYKSRVVDFLTGRPSHLLKMRELSAAPKLAGVYVLGLAAMTLALAATLWLVRRESDFHGRPADFFTSVAIAAGLLAVVVLWIASGRV
jgi:hypothetical protein